MQYCLYITVMIFEKVYLSMKINIHVYKIYFSFSFSQIGPASLYAMKDLSIRQVLDGRQLKCYACIRKGISNNFIFHAA